MDGPQTARLCLGCCEVRGHPARILRPAGAHQANQTFEQASCNAEFPSEAWDLMHCTLTTGSCKKLSDIIRREN
ncbi:hypothetical protein GCM10009837_52570 [Streptomyces durmitorensis]